ncbi:peptidylprolyl isomerase [Candidatus Woesearchaeota archaeon]|nr:peptidylprolyl isomerase [Candidatus Woesearchaeota archaeon]
MAKSNVSKRIPRKNKKKESKPASDLREKAVSIIKRTKIMNLTLSLIFIIVLAAGVGLIYLNSVDSVPGFLQKAFDINNVFFPQSATPAAIVNGEEISVQELEDRYTLIPEEYRQFISKEDVLLQMIDEKILLQESEKEGISVSQEEIDQQIDELLDQSGTTREEFEASMLTNGLEWEEIYDFYMKELMLNKLINMTVINRINITEKDLNQYYLNNLDIYRIPESVNVSHILICHNESQRCVSNLTKEEAFDKALSVIQAINETNFAEMALESSDEPAAKYTNGNLGWVSKEDPFDKDFLNETFMLGSGEVSEPVETVFGYHIIKVFEKKEEGVVPFDSLREEINQTLNIEMQNELFNDYIAELKEKSEIINFIES